jgi:hypothetical protein
MLRSGLRTASSPNPPGPRRALSMLAQLRWRNTRPKIAITLTANQRVSLPFTSRFYGINLWAEPLSPSSNPAPISGTRKYQRGPDRMRPWRYKAAWLPKDGARSEQRSRTEPDWARDEDRRLRWLHARDIRNIRRLRKAFFRCRHCLRAKEHFGALAADSCGQRLARLSRSWFASSIELLPGWRRRAAAAQLRRRLWGQRRSARRQIISR